MSLNKTLPNQNRCGVCAGILAPPKGVTYLAQREHWIKIGVTTGSVERRLKKLSGPVPQVITPAGMDLTAPLVLVQIIDYDVEHLLHEQFRDHHAAGEWFLAAPVLEWLGSAR